MAADGNESHKGKKRLEEICICGEEFSIRRFAIQCDGCKEWFHGECVFIEEYEAEDIDRFHCCCCEYDLGPSVPKIITNNHRHDRTDPDAHNKPVQSGTARFVELLKSRTFACSDAIRVMRGHQLTFLHFIDKGFESPILVETTDGLDLTVPSPNTFTYETVMQLIGENYDLDVIDVTRQSNIKMKMSDFVYHFSADHEQRTNIYNCISLEVSSTPLAKLIKAPQIVDKLSWVENYWPNVDSTPQVSKYCLMSMKDSYTNFHMDFGGTSVWYHVLKGQKVFYLVPPNKDNIGKYESWMLSPNSSEQFLGDNVEGCHRLLLLPGQTLLIPTGWIHAVLTPEDSIVFGGNFLHSLNISLQLEIAEMEHRLKTPDKFQFPYFELTHWYAAPNINKLLEDNLRRFPPKHLVNGVKALIPVLRKWFHRSKSTPNDGSMLAPNGFNCRKLIKDLSTTLRQAERRLNGLPMVKSRGKSYKSFDLDPQLSQTINLDPQLSQTINLDEMQEQMKEES